mmetsp:Transcript_62507/g.104023  ORF Transcript_62507/g.104023 Transcript_62507/m.104023 type:complete len:98 (+) Transcript_62507:1-294(+)
MMPFFFSAEQLAAGWVRNGRPSELAPQDPLMMDLRTLVAAMRKEDSVRAKAVIVTSTEGYATAHAVIAEAKAFVESAESAGNACSDASDVAAAEEEV